jgi:hypothetical protein
MKHQWLTDSLSMLRLKLLKLKSDTKLEGSADVRFAGSRFCARQSGIWQLTD